MEPTRRPPLVERTPNRKAPGKKGGVDAGVADAAPAAAKPEAEDVGPTQDVIDRSVPKLMACFAKFPAAAPSRSGRYDVTLWVDGTGRVTKADVDLPESDVSRCVRGVAKTIRFRPGFEKQVKEVIPLQYRAP